MQQIFQINTENLNSKFIESVKTMFGKKEVKIIIEDIDLAKSAARNEVEEPNNEAVQKFLDHRKHHPSMRVAKGLDFNSIVDEINN